MTVTHAKATLQAVETAFNIQKSDADIQKISKFVIGSAAKIAAMGIATFEYAFFRVGTTVFTSKAEYLTAYANQAAQVFVNAARSLNRPFAPKKKSSEGCCGFFKKTIVIEGPTISSYLNRRVIGAKERALDISAFAAKNKVIIAVGIVFITAGITLYYFAPSLFSSFGNAPIVVKPPCASVPISVPSQTRNDLSNNQASRVNLSEEELLSWSWQPIIVVACVTICCFLRFFSLKSGLSSTPIPSPRPRYKPISSGRITSEIERRSFGESFEQSFATYFVNLLEKGLNTEQNIKGWLEQEVSDLIEEAPRLDSDFFFFSPEDQSTLINDRLKIWLNKFGSSLLKDKTQLDKWLEENEWLQELIKNKLVIAAKKSFVEEFG